MPLHRRFLFFLLGKRRKSTGQTGDTLRSKPCPQKYNRKSTKENGGN
jgi:hypothetical protein